MNADRISTAMLVATLREYPRSGQVAVYDKDSGDYEIHDALPIALRRLEELEAKLAQVTEALTPSSATNAAYIGEVRCGERLVSWTAIKDVLALVCKRAALGKEVRDGE